jgi:replicative DNA helicase Mcm
VTETLDPQSIFLSVFKQEKYRIRLRQLAIDGRQSLTVDFEDVLRCDNDLAKELIAHPEKTLPHAKHAAMQQLQIEDLEYSNKLLNIDSIEVRIANLFASTPLREIGSFHIGKMILIEGIVIRASYGKPRVINGSFECRSCGFRQMMKQDDPSASFLKKPIYCANPECQRKSIFDYVEEESEFIDQQEIWVQESPDELPPGQMPRSLQLKLYGETVNVAHPGDNIAVVGIVRSLQKKVKGGTLNTVDVFIDVNSINTLSKEASLIMPEPEEISRIQDLARDPCVQAKVFASIAPSIHGYEHVKEAVAYLLFGGVPKDLPDIKIRGELNVLLIGDPGTAKSQLLRYVARLAPRGIFCSGKGTSGVGLTAAVIKDQESQAYTLEAGAMVLADRGTICIDEFDKMNDSDRETIHETLEQHTVSVAKAGIYATLNARCACLAAANPVMGRYNSYQSIVENISLPVTLLSRFDLIFLMRDVPNESKDTELSGHILGIHRGEVAVPVIPPELLRKYVSYARQLRPRLTVEAEKRIQQFYLQMRKASSATEDSPLAIGPRQLEALARISEACARIALREEVTVEDTEAAINIMMKSLREVGLDISSGKVDIDLIMTGKPKNQRDKVGVILTEIVEKQKAEGMVSREELHEVLAEKYGIQRSDATKFISQLLREGTLFEPREGYLKRT